MEYDGGTTFVVAPQNGNGKHCCTISNINRVVSAINDGSIPNINTATICEIKDAAHTTASESYIRALLSDPRIV